MNPAAHRWIVGAGLQSVRYGCSGSDEQFVRGCRPRATFAEDRERKRLGGSIAGFASPRMMSGALGATIGGAKDIGYARRLIEQGHVPNFIDFSPEGLYSEHDIPTPSGECNAKLCLSLGYGFAPAADDRTNALFLHLGNELQHQGRGVPPPELAAGGGD
ncbi:MAG: hypothetical protein IPM61_16495 [Chlorobi bacterium]|nr:hypothetical protein [Chlorobiota bacterium]